ncbi:MAG: hypothetical protein IKP27_08795 [Paludibacteraceae bacterium]|nr:hypothetical protein [Paludibacteraceae bacterium]
MGHDKDNKNFSFSYTQKIRKGRWEKQGCWGFEFESFVPKKMKMAWIYMMKKNII